MDNVSAHIAAPRRSLALFDNDPAFISICGAILQERGWTMHTFTDSRNLISKVSDCRPSVILMDNSIPGGGGVKAAAALKDDVQLKHIPIIYLSANADIALLAEKAGAERYLLKPFGIDELMLAISGATTQIPSDKNPLS